MYLMRLLILSVFFCSIGFSAIQAQNTDKNCESACNPPKKDEAHFNPYYNHHLCENFDPKQSDFSETYLKLRTQHSGENMVQGLASHDVSALWITTDDHQNGVIGMDYKRIKIFIGKVVKDPSNRLMYHVEGKSNVNGNICNFRGEIRILSAYKLDENNSESSHENSWHLFSEYDFPEDKNQKYTGAFKGIMECFYYIDNNGNILLDKSSDISDNYFNRTYVGTWTSHSSKAVKKCIWGDYRLPFTFDFDCGDGEMHVCEKYTQNGWASFNSGGEYDIKGDKAVLKDQWWKK